MSSRFARNIASSLQKGSSHQKARNRKALIKQACRADRRAANEILRRNVEEANDYYACLPEEEETVIEREDRWVEWRKTGRLAFIWDDWM